jgi:murein DD-endopeptidase MepM/ murein hydrolase activator NlpD
MLRTDGMLFARSTGMGTKANSRRRGARRVEVRIPFTCARDIAFGVSLRAPRRRVRRGERIRRWASAANRTALVLVTIAAPMLTVAALPDLFRAGSALLRTDAALIGPLTAPETPRTLPVSRSLTTVVSPDPPRLRAHIVVPGDTLLSIAARFGITPQTLAFDNGIVDTSQIRAGQALIVPPFDAAIHILQADDTIADVATRFGLDPATVRAVNRIAADDSDATEGRALLLPMPDARYPGFRLRVSDPPRVLAPRLRWPTDGVITQLYSPAHQGVDIAAPTGTPIVAVDAGTVSGVGWRGPGGLAVCVYHDWGLETCAYHASTVFVEVGERVRSGERIAAVGDTGITSGPHVHWEARTNGALVDPLTYAPQTATASAVGGATGSP